MISTPEYTMIRGNARYVYTSLLVCI